MGKCRVKVSHLEFPTIYGDWKEYDEANFSSYREAIGDACLGEGGLILEVDGNFKFFGVELLKNAIVTLEIEKDGEGK